MLSGLKKKRKKPTLSRGGRAPARGSSLARPPFSFRPHYSPARQAGFSTEGRVSQEGWARAPLSATQCPVGGLLFLIGCFWDNGHLYRADQPSPAPGHSCLNWLDAQSGLAFAPESGECPSRTAGGRAGGGRVPTPTHGAFSPLSGAGNHSYCRNPDQDPRGPWCYVSGEAGAPEKRPCQDLRCPGTQTPRPGLPRYN